jgi:uncharacterized protein
MGRFMREPFEVKLSRERLVSGESFIEGLGVFATMGFRSGELISILQGEKITIPELKRRYKAGTERLDDPLQVSERLYLDMDEPFVRINHSCDPNTVIVGESNLIALRPIEKGEELTFDYSLTEWTWERFGKYSDWSIKCDCGSQNCRGYITQFPFVPIKIKERYFKRGLLQDFILRKIIKAGIAYNGKIPSSSTSQSQKFSCMELQIS